MSKYIGKRVSYSCDTCGKPFSWSAESVDDRDNTGMFCSSKCAEEKADETLSIKLRTYSAWSKSNDGACRKFSHYEKGARYFHIRNRPTILRDKGFRQISGGWLDDCSTATNSRDDKGKVIRLTPRQAVLEFVAEYDAAEVVYYPDGQYYGHFVVWIK